jgi:hypothetical protein
MKLHVYTNHYAIQKDSGNGNDFIVFLLMTTYVCTTSYGEIWLRAGMTSVAGPGGFRTKPVLRKACNQLSMYQVRCEIVYFLFFIFVGTLAV